MICGCLATKNGTEMVCNLNSILEHIFTDFKMCFVVLENMCTSVYRQCRILTYCMHVFTFQHTKYISVPHRRNGCKRRGRWGWQECGRFLKQRIRRLHRRNRSIGRNLYVFSSELLVASTRGQAVLPYNINNAQYYYVGGILGGCLY